jgi:hypothetical protein
VNDLGREPVNAPAVLEHQLARLAFDHVRCPRDEGAPFREVLLEEGSKGGRVGEDESERVHRERR